jgi:Ni,Fe-hydrogenase maturation factor
MEKEGIGREQFTFDTLQMWETLKFVKKLEEQPIVVELCQYEDDKLSIELSQFVKRF